MSDGTGEAAAPQAQVGGSEKIAAYNAGGTKAQDQGLAALSALPTAFRLVALTMRYRPELPLALKGVDWEQ